MGIRFILVDSLSDVGLGRPRDQEGIFWRPICHSQLPEIEDQQIWAVLAAGVQSDLRLSISFSLFYKK